MGKIRRWPSIAARAAGLAGLVALVSCSSAPEVLPPYKSAAYQGPHYKLGKPYRINGRWYQPEFVSHYQAVGVASWYGRRFHGRPTANGEVYDMHALTAAHPTLPLPSLVRVTHLQNGRSLVLRVNDRGPFVKNREIDLSQGAARALGFERQGLARVHVAWLGLARLEDAIVALDQPLRNWDDTATIVLADNEICAPVPRYVWVC